MTGGTLPRSPVPRSPTAVDSVLGDVAGGYGIRPYPTRGKTRVLLHQWVEPHGEVRVTSSVLLAQQ